MAVGIVVEAGRRPQQQELSSVVLALFCPDRTDEALCAGGVWRELGSPLLSLADLVT